MYSSNGIIDIPQLNKVAVAVLETPHGLATETELLMQSNHTTRLILCKCGCGQEIPYSKSPSRQRKYIGGHQPNANRPVAERFWEKVNVCSPDDCWEWKAFRSEWGYGLLNVNGHPESAHRISYELHFGCIPDGMFVCHKCDNPPCVNPSHLWLGTHQDNTDDRTQKSRQPVGENHPSAKLTDIQVIEIRERYAQGEFQRDLAIEYGVAQSNISQIVNRKRRGYIP